jgi:hypothetical protein
MKETDTHCFTGQPWADTNKKFVGCVVCSKNVSPTNTGWMDKDGKYRCKSCLSEERKAEINTTRSSDNPAYFDSEKHWVESEQDLKIKPGFLETAMTGLMKYGDDPVMVEGISKLLNRS